MIFANTGGNAYVGRENSVGNTLGSVALPYALALVTETAYPIEFVTNNVTRAIIDSSGNVGIGTTSPAAKLDINGGTTEDQFRLGTDANYYKIGRDSVSGPLVFTGTQTGVVGYVFKSNSTEFARIDTSGNLLVGTTTASASPATGVQLCNTSGTLGGVFIGHDTGTANGNYYATFAYASGIIGSITQSTTSAVLYNTTSDYRRKSNVQDLTGSGTFIDALKPRTFDWDTGDKGVGFIAHEFAEVSPSSVCGEKDAVDSDGKPVYQGMQASSAEVIANLVAELQSVRQRLAALESN
jgi:hypothetical protein